MALKKKVMSDYGFEGEYWVIDAISFDKPQDKMHVVLRQYANREAYKTGMKPLGLKSFDFKATDYDVTSNMVEQSYDKIKNFVTVPARKAVGKPGDKNYQKAQPAEYGIFKDAEDVFEIEESVDISNLEV